MQLRNYQQLLSNDIQARWSQGYRNVMVVAPTGSGKTVLFSDTIAKNNAPCVAIAHRQELVGQMSLSLAQFGIRHRVIGPTNVIRNIVKLQVFVLGKSFYDPSAQVAVAGVQTLIRRGDELRQWLPTVNLWIMDECHHLLRGNSWGKAVKMFPNARGLGVTATPCRADGAGLGAHADGVFDSMVVGPTGRELIQQGYLADYRIFAPPSDLDFSTVKISKTTGDYVKNQMVKATGDSKIMGDIVDHYLRIAPGTLGIAFLPSVELATETSDRFNAAGVPSMVVSAKTPDLERVKILRKFSASDIKILVNVDLFGEGFDLPKLETTIMGRKTASYSLYCQQFGRNLRPNDGKTHGILIDHVGNVQHHGLPDGPQDWTMDARDKTYRETDPDLIPVRTCVSCTAVYEAWEKICPYCNEVWQPAERATPEQVDGDLMELDPTALAELRNRVEQIDSHPDTVSNKLNRAGAPAVAAMGAAKNHRIRQEYQALLRSVIAQWAGYQRSVQRSDTEIYTRFYRLFGTDIMTAQTLGKADAEKLTVRISNETLNL